MVFLLAVRPCVCETWFFQPQTILAFLSPTLGTVPIVFYGIYYRIPIESSIASYGTFYGIPIECPIAFNWTLHEIPLKFPLILMDILLDSHWFLWEIQWDYHWSPTVFYGTYYGIPMESPIAPYLTFYGIPNECQIAFYRTFNGIIIECPYALYWTLYEIP